MSGLPGWDVLEDRDDDRPPGRSRLIVAAAVAPWLVVAVVALRQPAGADATLDPVPTPAASEEPAPDDASATIAPDEAPATSPDLELATAGMPEAPGAAQAAGVAMFVARSWLSEVGPDLDAGVGSAGTQSYVEQLQADDVSWPSPGSAVVSLSALLLESDGERYLRARPVRLAVPLRLDAEGVRPAGTPWWLPAPVLDADEPPWRPIDDPDVGVAAGEALVAAGYEDVSVHAVETSDVWPYRVQATAVAPGASSAAEHTVWLRDHLGQLVVAGAPVSEVTR